jgi:cytochrome c oxidase subunit 3
MPAVKTTPPSKVISPDSGGRGTDHKLPTGGGGDGEWSNRPERRGPRERLYRARIALAVLMVTSLGLFATISFGYLWRKGQFEFDRVTHTYISAWTPISIPSLLWWNTGILILSSLALEVARREYFREEVVMDEWFGIARPTLRRALPWEILSLLLASAFIAGQIYAWKQLQTQGIFLGSGPSSQFYYFLTGLHGLHLLGGMIVLIWAMVAAILGTNLESRQVAVDITAWYWHAITVVWFGIFGILKISQ